ncbi:hypothetical protein RIF29_14257 [Crotalaria pallida]|uniref:Ribonuclease H n=1 Tax=Crotalaria pallida TaxID=3830 RepID=A0AAN9FH74_CROPI
MGKFYVVFEGRTPGVYDNWAQCMAQVHEFSGCSYCSFPTKLEADREYARFMSKMKNSGGADLRKESFEDNDAPGSSMVIGEDQCTIGRFAKGEFLAREDAALFMLRRLLAWSNREIIDFNHFNLKDLEVQNAVLEAQNVELIVENEKLKNELKMLRRKFNLN